MSKITKFSCLLSIVVLAGCSSGSSSPTLSAGATELQGTWVEPCFPDATDNSSERIEFEVTGNALVISDVNYIDTQTCSSAIFIKQNQLATFTLTGDEAELAGGNAKHIDLLYSGGSINASPAFLSVLEAQGTTLQAAISAQGITGDINNLTLEQIGRTQPDDYSIYRIDTLANGDSELRVGDDNDTYDGLSPALRPIELSTTIRLIKLL